MAIKSKKVSTPSRATPPARPMPSAPSTGNGGRSNGHSITAEERYNKIAQAAYYRAEQRGYEPGHEVEDWLAAEAEVDAEMRGTGTSIK